MLNMLLLIGSFLLLVLCFIPKMLYLATIKVLEYKDRLIFLGVIISAIIWFKFCRNVFSPLPKGFMLIVVIFLIIFCCIMLAGVLTLPIIFGATAICYISEYPATLYDKSLFYIRQYKYGRKASKLIHETKSSKKEKRTKREKVSQTLHGVKEAEAGLQYFINEDKKKESCYVKFLK